MKEILADERLRINRARPVTITTMNKQPQTNHDYIDSFGSVPNAPKLNSQRVPFGQSGIPAKAIFVSCPAPNIVMSGEAEANY